MSFLFLFFYYYSALMGITLLLLLLLNKICYLLSTNRRYSTESRVSCILPWLARHSRLCS